MGEAESQVRFIFLPLDPTRKHRAAPGPVASDGEKFVIEELSWAPIRSGQRREVPLVEEFGLDYATLPDLYAWE